MAGPKKNEAKKKAKLSPKEEKLRLQALGRAIATLREERTPYSRFQFALEADVHRNSMNAIEHGNVSTGFAVLLRIADTIGVSMTELMEAYEQELARDSG